MNYTLSQAAKVTGKSKSSISRAIDGGRLSATRNGGLFEIDAAELHRVFPLKVDSDGVPPQAYHSGYRGPRQKTPFFSPLWIDSGYRGPPDTGYRGPKHGVSRTKVLNSFLISKHSSS